jgi:acetylornithine aminotransferase
MEKPLMPSYQRQPIAFVRGEGPYLWDEGGRRYLDALGGVAVCGLGHAHPAIAAALAEQAARLIHTSNIFRIPLQEHLGARLTALAGMDNAFFCNSGAEANEAAIKIARLHGHACGIEVPRIVVMEGSFHGRTLATLSATGNRKIQLGFEPLVEGFLRVPYGDLPALAGLAGRTDIAAVLLEPIQGESGVNVPPAGYLRAVRELCDRQGWLMMLDEVQTGMCRTGRWFGFQHEQATPDVMSLAKSLGNGMPIGACLARGRAAELIRPGSHGSTFGGNLLACRAALAVIETMKRDDIAAHADSVGRFLMDRLRADLAAVPGVRDLRGRGLMIGIELERPCGELVGEALAAGLLINVTAERVVRLLPPLILTQEQAATVADTLVPIIRAFAGAAA